MIAMVRLAAVVALALATSACLGALMGGGKAPSTLLTLTPVVPPPAAVARLAAAGETITVDVPVVPKELRAVRVPVQVDSSSIAYVKDAQWVDTPDRLFQKLLAETILRTTRRVVLDPRQSALDPGLRLSGQLHRFGYDVASGSAVAVYDGALSTPGSARVETRRFTASVPASGDKDAIGPALNAAANRIAADVAKWVGG